MRERRSTFVILCVDNDSLRGRQINRNTADGRGRSQGRDRSQSQARGTCTKCGKGHSPNQTCPAEKSTCNVCKNKGHFTDLCFFAKSNNNDDNSNNNNRNGSSQKQGGKKVGKIQVYRVETKNKSPQVSVKLYHSATGKKIGSRFAIADTGAEVCVAGPYLLPKNMLNGKHLLPPKSDLVTFDGENSPCIGILPARLANQHYAVDTEIYVCSAAQGKILLSLDVCKNLGYIRGDFPDIILPKEIRKVKKWTIPDDASAAALKKPVDEGAIAKKRHESILKYRDQYDSRAADLSSLKVGQSVRIQDMVSKLWEKTGKIERICADQRSYKVLADNGKVYWRNRKFLRPIPDASADIDTDLATESPPLPASAGGRGKRKVRFRSPIDDADGRDTAGELRRSSRRRRRPDFYGTSTSTTLDRAQGGDGVGATN